jgi:hypothetical protein
MLFRINMYPAGRERRVEADARARRFASVTVVVAVNALVVLLFLIGVQVADRAANVRDTRLVAAEGAIAEILKAKGGAITRDDLELVRMRAAQVSWSRVLESLAGATPREVILSRVKLAEAAAPGSQLRTPGLRLTGRLRAGSEEAGLTLLMGFLGRLRDDEYFAKHFHEPKLMDSTWLRDEAGNVLEFDVFCPAEAGVQMTEGAPASASQSPQPGEVERVGPGDASTTGGTGGQHEGSL